MSPAGRPPRNSESYTRMLRVRLTEAEWDELQARSAKAGLSLSDYARAKMFSGKKEQR